MLSLSWIRPILKIDESLFQRNDWTHSVYGDVKEEVIPEADPNYRKPRGKGFVIRAHVDSDHAGDSVTRRSRTGFIVHVNNAPIYWFSKNKLEAKLVHLDLNLLQ